jgi:hypothetical protein
MNAKALVLNVIFRKLGFKELWWLGVFIALNHLGRRWEGCWRWSDAPPDRHCSLSGSPLTSCSDFYCDTVHLSESTIAQIAIAPLAHRTVRWHTGQSGEL